MNNASNGVGNMNAKNTSTIAQKISERFGDGQTWVDDSGAKLMDVLEEHASETHWQDGWRNGDVISFDFADESVITVWNGIWDFGYPECYCLQGAGHTEDCKSA
jgi:hypothetical protein